MREMRQAFIGAMALQRDRGEPSGVLRDGAFAFGRIAR